MPSLRKIFETHGALLLVAGALVGVTLSGCVGPKQIGEESDTNIMGGMCEAGDTKPAPDGCNTCTCLDGEWACTDKACADEAPPEPECEEGEQMPAPDGCNVCACYQGAWACTQIGCVSTTSVGETGTDGEDETGDTAYSTGALSDGESGVVEPVCGDGELGGSEECDDGNVVDGDGCSADCKLEGISECQGMPQDPLELIDAKIEADTLVIDVAYGGGCAEHEIGYCWDGAFAESEPVQAWVDLWHDGNGDICDAYPHETRMLDLTQLKTAWQEGYQQEHGEIIVHLGGFQGELVYTF